MRLLSTVLLSVGATIILGALGMALSIPPVAFALSVSGITLVFVMYLAKYEEDIVLLPFAAASALFSFGSGVTTGVGVIVMMYALVQFLQIKENSKIPGRHTPPVWLAWRTASIVCALAPWALLQLSTMLFSTHSTVIVALFGGVFVFLTGIFLFHLHLKAEKKKRESAVQTESGKSQSETKATVHVVDLKMWSEPGWDKLRDHIREEISQDAEKEKAEDPNNKK